MRVEPVRSRDQGRRSRTRTSGTGGGTSGVVTPGNPVHVVADRQAVPVHAGRPRQVVREVDDGPGPRRWLGRASPGTVSPYAQVGRPGPPRSTWIGRAVRRQPSSGPHWPGGRLRARRLPTCPHRRTRGARTTRRKLRGAPAGSADQQRAASVRRSSRPILVRPPPAANDLQPSMRPAGRGPCPERVKIGEASDARLHHFFTDPRPRIYVGSGSSSLDAHAPTEREGAGHDGLVPERVGRHGRPGNGAHGRLLGSDHRGRGHSCAGHQDRAPRRQRPRAPAGRSWTGASHPGRSTRQEYARHAGCWSPRALRPTRRDA